MSKRKNKNTFRFPFDIDNRVFIGLAVFFFILSISQVNERIFPRYSVQNIKTKIENDVNFKINNFKELIKNDSLNSKLVQNNISKEKINELINNPFYLFIYKNDTVIFWNTNKINPPIDTFQANRPTAYFDKKGYYVNYRTEFEVNNEAYSAIAIIPIKNENPFNSTNYRNNFIVGDSENNFGIKLSLTPQLNSIPIQFNGEPLYYIFKKDDYFNINDKNGWRLFFNALPFIFYGISIHTYFKVKIKNSSPFIIFSILLISTIIIRTITYIWGFPSDFSMYSLFDSRYFATDSVNKSLGDTFINMCLSFWILLFYVVNVQGRVFDISKSKFKSLFGIFAFAITLNISIYLSNLTYEIIRDSTINFDTSIFSRMALFSFIGILTFMLIFANFVLSIIITNNYLNISFNKSYFKYIIVIIAYILFSLFITPKYTICYYYVFLCIGAIFYLLDLPSFKFKFDFNSYILLLWIIIISFAGSFFLTKMISEKEEFSRKEYAEKIITINDRPTENKLELFNQSIESDTIIRNFFFQKHISNDYNYLKNYINLNYIWNSFTTYNSQIHIFDKSCKNLNPTDTLQLETIQNLNKLEYLESDDTNNLNSVFLIENYKAKGYVTLTKVQNNNNIIGYISLSLFKQILDQKEDYSDFIYQDETTKKAKDYKYSTAIYEDSVLKTKQGNYSFLLNIKPSDVIKDSNFGFIQKGENNELWYKDPQSSNHIIVSKKSNTIYLFTTLFAYIFLIYFIVISLYILGNIVARSNLNYGRFVNLLSLNLRLRIHFAILVVVFLSFIAVGYYTSYYLIDRVKEKSRIEINNYSQSLQTEMSNYFNKNNLNSSTSIDTSLNNINSISDLQAIAERNRININLFSITNGELLFCSESTIYNSGLLSAKANPAAYYSAFCENKDQYINQEYIGDLDYLASYTFIRNNKNENIALMQIPYISSNAEIKSETTTILITLVNIYVFVFLFSKLLALLITNSVTRPFSYIVKQFTKINLSKTNQPLKWQYSDEIGLLVKEYNRMLRKLENSTILLAKSEREMAWREMAKQVAHEIKNPLTPMKLSLQMLERAIKNNSNNIPKITARVTGTLIEQIDNLSLIATNFSNFAKMPELKKEYFALNDVLYAVTGMYNDDKYFEYLFLIPDYSITIFADKSQLIRVFTNIIQNATQAIPEDRKGNISLVVSKVKDNYIRVTISDNGEGISKEKGEKLFQPYFTTKTSGTGLGLAMCKDIMEQFGGKITYESVEHEGTSFHIDLPILDEDVEII